MRFAEKLYWEAKELKKNNFHIESLWMTGSTFRKLKKEFLELEMGEVSTEGDMPVSKRKWKEGKEHKSTATKKEKHMEGIKALDIITTLNTLIKLVPPGTIPDGGGPVVKDGNYLFRYVYVGTQEQRLKEVKKVQKQNVKMEKEMQEDFGKKIARKVA